MCVVFFYVYNIIFIHRNCSCDHKMKVLACLRQNRRHISCAQTTVQKLHVVLPFLCLWLKQSQMNQRQACSSCYYTTHSLPVQQVIEAQLSFTLIVDMRHQHVRYRKSTDAQCHSQLVCKATALSGCVCHIKERSYDMESCSAGRAVRKREPEERIKALAEQAVLPVIEWGRTWCYQRGPVKQHLLTPLCLWEVTQLAKIQNRPHHRTALKQNTRFVPC